MSLFRTKSVEQSIAETEEPEHRLKKNLGALDLTIFGVGVIIGAGIFVYTGLVAATNAGPAISLSFLIAGLACALAALCYAEFASTVPVAGSAYTFSYATFGELVAWIIGWDLVLEFTVGASALAAGFSGYFQNVVEGTPLEVPASLASASDGIVNLPAVLITLLVTVVLIGGIKLSSRINQVIVAIKLGVVALVIVMGIGYIKASNYTPFIPPSEPTGGADGGFWKSPLSPRCSASSPRCSASAASSRVLRSCSSPSSASTWSPPPPRRPGTRSATCRSGSWIARDRHRALHRRVPGDHRHAVLPGHRSRGRRATGDGVRPGGGRVDRQRDLGRRDHRADRGRPHPDDGTDPRRVRDGSRRAAPDLARQGPPAFGTPYRITAITGVGVALLSGFVSPTLGDLVNIGTLFAFVLVSIGVLVLRRTRPDLGVPSGAPGCRWSPSWLPWLRFT